LSPLDSLYSTNRSYILHAYTKNVIQTKSCSCKGLVHVSNMVQEIFPVVQKYATDVKLTDKVVLAPEQEKNIYI